MQMRKASDDRDQAKDQTNTETDEIEGVHIIWCSVSQLFVARVELMQPQLKALQAAGRERDVPATQVSRECSRSEESSVVNRYGSPEQGVPGRAPDRDESVPRHRRATGRACPR